RCAWWRQRGSCSVVLPRAKLRSLFAIVDTDLTASHYTRTAVGLHWLVAGLIITGLFMGWTMTSMEVSPQKLKVYNWHKWVGVTVLLLAILRLVWRLTHRPPPLSAATPPWQRVAAHGGHALLYV